MAFDIKASESNELKEYFSATPPSLQIVDQMSDDIDFLDDDEDMLEAIKAAFGDGAIDMLADDTTDADLAELTEADRTVAGEGNSLQAIVDEIDEGLAATNNQAKNEPIAQEESVERFVVVQFGGSTLGIPMEHVTEIQTVHKITPLPRIPQWVLGVTNLRGNIISVVNLALLFDLQQTALPATAHRMVLIQSLIDDVATGLVVDRVLGIRGFETSKISRSSASSSDDMLARYMTGVTDIDDQLVALLDVDKLLLSPEFRLFEVQQSVTSRVSA